MRNVVRFLLSERESSALMDMASGATTCSGQRHMPKRETRIAKDISDLAALFGQSWREGQVLRSWLRSHAAEIRKLIRDKDWSWEDIGRALTEAGVTYQTGTPWTGENLRRNLSRAEIPGKREIKLQRMASPEPQGAAQSTQLVTPIRLSNGANGSAPAMPEFQLIRRVGDSSNAPSELPNPPTKRPRPALTEAEIDAIVIGRSARR